MERLFSLVPFGLAPSFASDKGAEGGNKSAAAGSKTAEGEEGNEGDDDGGDDGDEEEPESKFTQADIDRVAKKERARGARKAVSELAKEYGMTPEEMKALLAEKKTKDNKDNKDGETKPQDDSAKKAAEAKTQKANLILCKAEFKLRAAAQVSDVDLAMQAALPKLQEVEVTEEGEVDTDAVDEIITELLKTHPLLKKGEGEDKGKGSIGGGGNPGGSGKQSPAEIGKAMAEKHNAAAQANSKDDPWVRQRNR